MIVLRAVEIALVVLAVAAMVGFLFFVATRKEPSLTIDARRGEDLELDAEHRAAVIHVEDVWTGTGRSGDLAKTACEEGYPCVVLDFSTCYHYADGAMSGVLIDVLGAHKGTRVVLCGLAGKIKVVFDMLGLSKLFQVFASPQDVVAAWRSGSLR